MTRFIFLFIAAFFTLALAPKGEAPIGKNIDDAHKLVEGRCKTYLAARKSKISNIFKDEECDEAQQIVADDVAAKSINILVSSLEKLMKSLPSSDSYSEDEKLRYILYGTSMREPDANVEEIVEGCLEDKQKAKQNRPGCRVATEVMLDKLKSEQEVAQKKISGDDKDKENFKRYFTEHPAEVDAILDGKCKKILENPWYKFDVSMHDKECEAALIIRDSLKRSKMDRSEKDSKRGKEYYSKNIFEAQENAKKCEEDNADISPEECEVVTKFVKQQGEYEKDSTEYKKYWLEHLGEARKFIKECQQNTDAFGMGMLRCQMAMVVVNEEIKKRKEARRLEKYKENFRNNIEDAKNTLESGCVEKDIECEAAEVAVAEYKLIKSQEALMAQLIKYLDKNKPSAAEKEKYDLVVKNLRKNKKDMEGFVASCINDATRASKSHVECEAGASAFLASLQEQQEAREKAKSAKPKNREYYIRYFSSNPDAVDKILEGRCKDVFSDPWYDSDDELHDVECDTALSISHQNQLAAEEKAIAKNRKEIKDKGYFIKNYSEAESLWSECKGGKIDNLDECEASMHVVTEKIDEEGKKVKYSEYYNGHPLAAKFFIRWCQNSMLNFNVKCKAAEAAVKKYSANKKPKIYKDEIFDKYVKKFKETPQLAKDILIGKCKTMMEDPWYYLDESIRSEQCDAAAEIARLVMESKGRKKVEEGRVE